MIFSNIWFLRSFKIFQIGFNHVDYITKQYKSQYTFWVVKYCDANEQLSNAILET
jgi:hypothetical protein